MIVSTLRARRGRRHGFTLVEVLATLMLIAIVLPAVMRGIALATAAGSTARRRTEASSLAEAKMNEIIATQQWEGGTLAGDFAPDWPDYHWQATVQPWPQDNTGLSMQQLDMRVTWGTPDHPGSVTLSTLVYDRTQTAQTQ